RGPARWPGFVLLLRTARPVRPSAPCRRRRRRADRRPCDACRWPNRGGSTAARRPSRARLPASTGSVPGSLRTSPGTASARRSAWPGLLASFGGLLLGFLLSGRFRPRLLCGGFGGRSLGRFALG